MFNQLFTTVLPQTKSLVFCSLVASLFSVSIMAQGASKLAYADLSLQNLERERAALIKDLLSPSLDIEQRHRLLKKRQAQLTDMERMVMRDERLLSSSSPLVRNAFKQYELTFLVHAGAEQKRTASEHWLATMNISNDAIISARMGFRK